MSVATVTRPAFTSSPAAHGSYVDGVAMVADMIGRPLDASQRLAVETMAAHDAGGLPVALEACVVGPRQTVGKTAGIILPIVLFETLFGEPDLTVWTAHRFDTTEGTFRDLRAMVAADDDGRPMVPDRFVPELASRLITLRQSSGDMGFTFRNESHPGAQASIEFQARSGRAGRGKSGRIVVVDEALYFTGDQAGALLPLLATRPGAMVLYGSSAAKAAESDYLRALVRRGRAGGDPSLAFVEWCSPGSWDDPGCKGGRTCDHMLGAVGCVLDDEALWVTSNNPSIGHGRSSLEFLRSMRRTLPPLEFGREFLGWHEAGEVAGDSPIAAKTWAGLAAPGAEIVGRPVFGLAVSWDSKSAAIAAAGWGVDGIPVVWIVQSGVGDSWVADACAGLKDKRPKGWAVAPKTAAAGLIPSLTGPGLRLRLTEMTPADCAASCAGLQSRARAGIVRHLGDEVLAAAVAGAQRRDSGDGMWVWAPKRSEVDIVTLFAVTNALWLLESTPRGIW